MKHFSIFLLFCFCTLAGVAQGGKALQLKEIVTGEFTPENIRIIRPGYGIAPKYFNQLLGQTSKRNIQRGDPIIDSDLEC